MHVCVALAAGRAHTPCSCCAFCLPACPADIGPEDEQTLAVSPPTLAGQAWPAGRPPTVLPRAGLGLGCLGLPFPCMHACMMHPATLLRWGGGPRAHAAASRQAGVGRAELGRPGDDAAWAGT